MLDEIDKLIEEKNLNKEGLIFCDIFSGTATVGEHYNGFYKIVANDILDFSYEYSRGKILGYKANFEKLGFDPFEYFKNCDYKNYMKGFCYNTFSPKRRMSVFQ